MSALNDGAVARLRRIGSWPELTGDRYELIEEIGRGGMGTVYSANDRELGREVAIKVPNAADSAGLERRLQHEARVLARLEHPGIVPVHDVGRLADGRLFYVMKRVRGQTLRQFLQDAPDRGERLRIFERICEPVAFAHDAGVIHRDLKPDNVMVGAFGEVMVMDWGVAKQLGEAVSPSTIEGIPGPAGTEAGTVIGTPGFMPPEQARGDAAEADVRSDVYSLGAILHLLLSGSEPRSNPEHGSVQQPGIERSLQAVCARALAAQPAGRYPSVEAMAEDIARFRRGEPVSVHRESLVERTVRLARVYRVAILLVLGYIIMRATVALVAGW